MINISLNTAKLQHDECLISRIQNMATFGGPLAQDPATSLGQHTTSSYWSTLQAHDQQQWTHHSICFNWWVNRWYSISLDTIFSYRNLCNGYRIANICRFRAILLLLFLVPTCWISMLIFSIRSLWDTVVNDDVEAAPIYRWDGKAGQPIIRPCKNHDLCMKWEPTWTESQQNQQTQSKALPTCRSLGRKSKTQGMWWAHMVCCKN